MQKTKLLFFMILAISAVIVGCVTIDLTSPTSPPTAVIPSPQPIQPTQTMQPSLPTLTPIVIPPTATTSAGASQVNIYLIALEDNGASGKKIGCNDSVVPVVVNIQPTLGVLRAALTELFKLEGQPYYGQSGLYNALAQSDLAIQSLDIVNRLAVIRLTGSLLSGGVCDDPRIKAQLEEIALQFSTIDQVSIYINGIPLDSLLSGQG